ncbi:hypothetical protein NA57DRAFT_59038 [Rhizodiscina lignyota]|uniref:Uncharacterized protein n=1 Tax=Rhizodiscina lignyota TaxID=1504668 RepID=A0A9P4I6C2_9PEZI|nr:hypothetical protein NA57DRAFT_59038 [Rhizodiscina lignyota]
MNRIRRILDNTRLGYNDLEGISIGGNADRFLDATATVSEYRARFTTEHGMFGVGPMFMELNDMLCILYGATVAFIIRPKGAGYLLMGECYVYDLMRGEAVEPLSEAWVELL